MREYHLEVCIDSLESAQAAILGGAHRLEVCSSLGQGGVTPSLGLLRLLQRIDCDKQEIDGLPRPQLFCMVRPRGGHYTCSALETTQMKEDIKAFRNELADGVVVGVTDGQHSIQRGVLEEMCKLAHPMRVTFHRAFDTLKEPIAALEQLSQIDNIDRILTSGQAPTALQGLPLLSTLSCQASTLPRPLSIMAGGGITPSTLPTIAQSCAMIHEFHASASVSQVLNDPTPPGGQLTVKVTKEEIVKQLIDVLNGLK